jgi:hypothetical protein
LDVAPRPAIGALPSDPASWFAIAGTEHNQGADLSYGGWGQDALQANVGDQTGTNGDRLLDWFGTYNVYYQCQAAQGASVVTKDSTNQIITFLQRLAESDGTFNPAKSGTSGFREAAIVFKGDARQNTRPPHPDDPTHFICPVQ